MQTCVNNKTNGHLALLEQPVPEKENLEFKTTDIIGQGSLCLISQSASKTENSEFKTNLNLGQLGYLAVDMPTDVTAGVHMVPPC